MSTPDGHYFVRGTWSWQVYDAHGRPVRIERFFARAAKHGGFCWRAINRWKVKRVADRGSGDRIKGLAPNVVTIAFILSLGIPGWLAELTNDLWFRLGLLILPPLVVWWMLSLRFVPPRKQIAAMLDDCACPSCVQNLTGVRPDADGCTLCPECGAAWRMEATDVAERQAADELTAPAS